jgi:hypothetical protein
MTRTDQAPEPTMEEILASIRLIISDDAKKVPLGLEDHPSRPASPRVDTAPLNALPEEEVLDLTDALAPEERPLPIGPSRPRERYVMPAAAPHEEPEEDQPRAQEDAIVAEQEPAHEAGVSAQPAEAQLSSEPRHDLSRPTPPSSRTVWSRRELPRAPSPVADPATRHEEPARQPQRNWAQDIQMPIPDEGPVSLIPGQTQPHVHESEDERETAEQMEAESDDDQGHGLDERREAAVAAIAESLARTAAGAMNSEELATAVDVDFSKLGEEQKAEVTETFAKAIERESAPRDKHPLPTLLDEVLRQDFIRESSIEEPADDSSEIEALSAFEESHEKAEDKHFAPKWGAPEIALQSAETREPGPQARSEAPSTARETLVPQETATVSIAPAPQPVPERAAASQSPLETAVRDMLRPLLERWLDEHMPRVLESAIREEIAARGLLPKTEK